MRPIHHHFALLALAVSVTAVVAATYLYVHHAIGVSTDKAVLAHDIISIEAAGKGEEQTVSQLYSSTAAGRSRVESLFIPTSASVSFIEAVEALGPAAGSALSLSSIEADSLVGAVQGQIGSISAAVSVRGGWSSVMRTLILAETLPYASTISDVRLNASPADGSTPASSREWALSFQIKAALIASSTPS